MHEGEKAKRTRKDKIVLGQTRNDALVPPKQGGVRRSIVGRGSFIVGGKKKRLRKTSGGKRGSI